MARQLLATKSIAELHEQESSGNQLRRALTATQLTLLGIGGIIGTGIFVLTGVAAADHAGPALPLSFIVAGLGCTFAGLCYAESGDDERQRQRSEEHTSELQSRQSLVC